MSTSHVFDSVEAAVKFYSQNNGFGEIYQTLRGAVQFCPIETQNDSIWVVDITATVRPSSAYRTLTNEE